MKSLLILMTAILVIADGNAQSTGSLVGADLIVYNAKISTGNLAQPNASAVAVKRGRIYAVGADAEMLGLKDNNTKVIDANGRRLIPV